MLRKWKQLGAKGRVWLARQVVIFTQSCSVRSLCAEMTLHSAQFYPDASDESSCLRAFCLSSSHTCMLHNSFSLSLPFLSAFLFLFLSYSCCLRCTPLQIPGVVGEVWPSFVCCLPSPSFFRGRESLGWKLVWRKSISQPLPSLKRQSKSELRGNY